MYDRSRSSPQPIHNHRQSSPVPPQLRPNEPNVMQYPSSSLPNSRMLQRTPNLNRSSTVVVHDKPTNQLPPQAASDHGHTRLHDQLNTITTIHPPPHPAYPTPSSRPSSRGAPSSIHSEDKGSPVSQSAPPSTLSQTPSNYSSSTISAQPCSNCGLSMSGQFVRALGNVYHLDCFRCRDCNSVVAQKFFPVEGQDGKQYPLCERDYFRRLNLICAKCDQALRASYITACGKKYHVEHFTCSVCPTLFGPQDSYYEHEGNVYCHFHYSTRFATKCVGCASAILKQFVEINRNMRDECWHPECYMIHKFWSVKLRSRRVEQSSEPAQQTGDQPPYLQEEQEETPESLREKQLKTEKQVSRIWSVLSSFEESSAACISDMLRHVSNGYYLEAVRMAEKFILHVETLFATIDDLETCFAKLSSKGMSHVREARLLCRKTVDLFTLLSHTQESGERRVGMTQELLALVTGLAHYLKILIRIALTGALKLERDHDFSKGLSSFLQHLQLLSSNKANPSIRRLKADVQPTPDSGCSSTQGVIYGYKSLAPEIAGETPFSNQIMDPSQRQLPTPYDLCMDCKITVEEDCVRLGTYRRWHSHCVKCKVCGKAAAPPLPHKESSRDEEEREREKEKEAKETKEMNLKDKNGKEPKSPAPPPKMSISRRPPALVDEFVFEHAPLREGTTPPEVPIAAIYCVDHGHAGCDRGFQAVTRLEQYAFLLNVALRRLYIVLKRRGVVPMSAAAAAAASQGQTEQLGFGNDAYRNSSDVMRMNSMATLDRKLSATSRVPKRSTVVESPPAGRVPPTSEARVGGDTASTTSTTPSSNANTNQRQSQLHLQLPSASSQLTLKQPQPRSAATSPMPLPTPLVAGRSPGPSTLPYTGSAPPVISWSPSLSPLIDDVTRGVRSLDDIQPQQQSISPSIEDFPSLRIQPEWSLDDVPRLVDNAAQGMPSQGPSRPLIGELSPLELAIVKHAAVLALWRSPLRDQFDLDEILDMVELKKSGWWVKIFKGNADKKNKNTRKGAVFGVPLEQLVERQGADSLLGASHEALRVPTFIDDVVSAMRQMDMSVEGIFRKNGNIRRLKDLSDAIDRDPQSVDLTQDNAVQLAALLKKFLRDLPEPLMTVKLFKLFTNSQMLPSPQDRQRCLHYISLILPKSHRDTMEVLFVFLKWVASFAHVDEETGSKMDLANLATVICPSILYGKGRDTAHTESVLAIPVVTELLVNQDEFWQVPEEFLPMLHEKEYFASSLDLSSKDFMKKCDAFLRSRTGTSGRPGGVTSPPPHPPSSSTTTALPNGHSTSLAAASFRPDGLEVRLVPQLVPQRSDPALTRGRAMPSDPARPPNPNRFKTESHSLERERNHGSPSSFKGGGNSLSLPPPLVHQPYSNPLPATPGRTMPGGADPLIEKSLSDADWAATQRPPPPIKGDGPLRSRSNSRPGSFDSSPASSNGRQSPRLS